MCIDCYGLGKLRKVKSTNAQHMAVVAQWLGCWPTDQKVVNLDPNTAKL